MKHWKEDPDIVVAVELIDEAHAYDCAARTAPIADVPHLRDAASKCRALAKEIRQGKRDGA